MPWVSVTPCETKTQCQTALSTWELCQTAYEETSCLTAPSGEHAALCNRSVGRDSQQNVQQVARLPQAENTQHCATAVLKETASLTAPSGEHAALCSCSGAKDSKLPTKPRSRVVAGGTKKLLEHNLASILSVHHAFIQDNESCVMQGTQICRKILHFEKTQARNLFKVLAPQVATTAPPSPPWSQGSRTHMWSGPMRVPIALSH